MSTLWTCAGCDVSVIPEEEGPLEQLARNGRPLRPDELQWTGGKSVHYSCTFDYTYEQLPGGEAPTEAPPFHIEGKPYCPGCAQPCGECGTPIFSRSELEAGDTYAAGSSFLRQGRYRKEDALCVDCFSMCCEECGADPYEECTCHAEDEKEEEVSDGA